MKHTVIILFFLTAAAQAVSFDTIGFGQRLNGWREDRTALYSLTDGVYRTHVPTITGTPGGGMFLSTQVDFGGSGSSSAVCHLALTFSSSGTLDGAQIRAQIEGRNLDTGLVRRPQPQPVDAPIEGDAAPPPAPLPGNPTDDMIDELFSRFDTEFKKVAEGKGEKKRDLFSRLGAAGPTSAHIAAGLRHNLNLILQHVNRHGSAKEVLLPTTGGAADDDAGPAARPAGGSEPAVPEAEPPTVAPWRLQDAVATIVEPPVPRVDVGVPCGDACA